MLSCHLVVVPFVCLTLSLVISYLFFPLTPLSLLFSVVFALCHCVSTFLSCICFLYFVIMSSMSILLLRRKTKTAFVLIFRHVWCVLIFRHVWCCLAFYALSSRRARLSCLVFVLRDCLVPFVFPCLTLSCVLLPCLASYLVLSLEWC